MITMTCNATLDLSGLQKLKDTLSDAKNARVNVGVFDTGNHDSGKSNATIGLAHEMGSNTGFSITSPKTGKTIHLSGFPKRSWLRMPLNDHLKDRMVEIGQATWDALINQHSLEYALIQLGFYGEETLREAFDTGGFGQWPPNSAKIIAWKGRNEPLVDTGELRAAVASEVTGVAS